LPRHSITTMAPGSSLLTSARTGAPAAFAFADGFQDPAKGTATPTTPAAATALVARVRKRRRLSSVVVLDMDVSSFHVWRSMGAGGR
jgi:hypothetical protein